MVQQWVFFGSTSRFQHFEKNFSENTLVYINNQVTISTINSELAIYVNCFVYGQIIPALNLPQDIDSCQCKQNEVKIALPLYDLSTGKFIGLDLQFGYIVLRGDPGEVFFSYGFNLETSKVLFSSSKERIPMRLHVLPLENIAKRLLMRVMQETVPRSFFTYLLQRTERNL